MECFVSVVWVRPKGVHEVSCQWEQLPMVDGSGSAEEKALRGRGRGWGGGWLSFGCVVARRGWAEPPFEFDSPVKGC